MQKIFFIFSVITFTICVLMNPGIPKREYYTKRFEKEYVGNFNKLVRCRKCNITIPKSFKVIHCMYCDICIKGYDHHCPWIGKCVGKNNRIIFICSFLGIFSFWVMSFTIFIMYVSLYHKEKKKDL